MKLNRLADVEVPIGEAEVLAELKRELKWMLGVVEFALNAHDPDFDPSGTDPKGSNSHFHQNGSAEPPPSQEGATLAARIRNALDKAPARFTSSHIYTQFPQSARNAIKDELKKRRLSGELEVIAMGKGRIATVYEKRLTKDRAPT